jgi:hypothetical protein
VTICAFGWEANPNRTARLQELESCYTKRGWRVKFATGSAVADVDGFTTFYTDFAMGQNLESGASIFNHRRKAQKGVNVTMVDLSRFIREEVKE